MKEAAAFPEKRSDVYPEKTEEMKKDVEKRDGTEERQP